MLIVAPSGSEKLESERETPISSIARNETGSVAALERVKASGARQSIISALRQDLLEEITTRLGVAKYMDRICGVDNLDGFGKIDRAKELISDLQPPQTSQTSQTPQTFVLIGDSLHDKEVADALGARCVLCGQGSHAVWRLRAVAPTGETLLDALDIALGGKDSA